MYRTSSKINEGTSSKLVQVETKPGLAWNENHTAKLWNCMASDDWRSPILIHGDEKMGDRTYLVGFRDVFESLHRREETYALYFYPHEVEGFIESCVMATQRENDVAQRDMQIYIELCQAMTEWNRMEEEAAFRRSGSVDYNPAQEEKDIARALKVGSRIDDIVRKRMRVIRDAHGDYAVDEFSFVWTPARALKMQLRF